MFVTEINSKEFKHENIHRNNTIYSKYDCTNPVQNWRCNYN